MSTDTWKQIDDYTGEILVSHDDALDAAARTGADAGLPELGVAPNQGKLLHLIARMSGARSVLEIGTFGGYSTIWLARALRADGRLVTLEAEEQFAVTARANLAQAGLGDIAEVRQGRALDELERLEREGAGPFDMFFVDADKAAAPDYLTHVLRLARPGSVLVVDNVVLQGLLVDTTSRNPAVAGMRRLHEMLAAEPRVCATSVQTVGSRGHDGFVLAVLD